MTTYIDEGNWLKMEGQRDGSRSKGLIEMPLDMLPKHLQKKAKKYQVRLVMTITEEP